MEPDVPSLDLPRGPRPSSNGGGSALLSSTSQLFALAKAAEGVPLLGNLPNSPAERVGLRRGDIVIACNGQPTPDVNTYLSARDLVEGQVMIRVFRDGKELDFLLEFA